jgi:hypothetical protein
MKQNKTEQQDVKNSYLKTATRLETWEALDEQGRNFIIELNLKGMSPKLEAGYVRVLRENET